MNLTVVTVCYNAKEDLNKTLESVLRQDYSDMEYLVVDGGSNDGSVELIRYYQKQFTKAGKVFRYVSEKDNGTYDAMNKGAMLAQGVWVNYMNAGDRFYADDTLSQFFSHDVNPLSGVVFGNTCQMFDFGKGIARYEDYMKDNPVMPFCHQSCFVKADLVRKYKFDMSYRIIADHDLFYRLHTDNVKYQYIDVVVACYNGQYGLSATHPLTLRKEGLRIHHINDKWYYPLALMWVYIRYGWVQPLKNHMPKRLTDAWMKRKRKFIE